MNIRGTPRQCAEAWSIVEQVLERYPVVEAFMSNHPAPRPTAEELAAKGDFIFVELDQVLRCIYVGLDWCAVPGFIFSRLNRKYSAKVAFGGGIGRRDRFADMLPICSPRYVSC